MPKKQWMNKYCFVQSIIDRYQLHVIKAVGNEIFSPKHGSFVNKIPFPLSSMALVFH